MSYVSCKMPSPVGELTLIASSKGLSAILWPENKTKERIPSEPTHPVLTQARQQLQEYFKGKRKSFDLPLDPEGTDFQKKVWKALATIPFGETRSYGQIAQQIRKATASRAVGAANGKNPLSIVVPCHRVIGANGKLTGFAGGLEAKKLLLDLELAPAKGLQ